MKKRIVFLMSLMLTVLALAACTGGDNTANDKTEDGKLKVVTSFTIIEDLAREIGGDDVNIHNLVPTGTDPHEYEPLPQDMNKATDADILFYNGLNLEGGDNGWFHKMIEAVNQDNDNVCNLTNRVEPMYITDDKGKDEEINPHAFISPKVGIKMAEDMRDCFIEKDPEHKENYEERANEYLTRLKEIEAEYQQKIDDIPEENRNLVTSERAFQYLANDYGLKEGYIWAIDTEETGSSKQINSLISFIEENDVPVLFIESNVDSRPMETVSEQTGVPLSSKPIYSDEIGKSGEEVDTYIKYLNYNINLIHDELSGN